METVVLSDLAEIFSSESLGISNNLLDMLTSFTFNWLFIMRDSANIIGFKFAVVLFALFSYKISGKKRVKKFKLMLSEVSLISNALISSTKFLLKITLCHI